MAFTLRSALPLDLPAASMPQHPEDGVVKTTHVRKAVGAGRQGLKKGGVVAANSECGTNARKRREASSSPLPSQDGDGDVVCTDAIEKVEGEKNEDDEEEEEDAFELVEETVREIDYCTLINRCLPEDIRVVGWCEVTPDFSSRFSASHRTYRYFFVRRTLDLDAMQQAAHLLVGEHDFRNLCKIDLANVTNFRREIYSAEILPFTLNETHPELSVYMLEIRGIAFLWHMVRCIMAVLFLVGGQGEEPEIVSQLLDVEALPAKPHYHFASEDPLVLHHCGFDSVKIHRQPRVLWVLTAHYEAEWERHVLAAARAKNALEFLLGAEVRRVDVEGLVSKMMDKEKGKIDRDNGKPKHNKKISSASGGGGGGRGAQDRKRAKFTPENGGEIQSERSGDATSSSSSSSSTPSFAAASSFSTIATYTKVAELPEMATWRQALHAVRGEHGISVPTPSSLGAQSQQTGGRGKGTQQLAITYVPLMQRQTGETYEERREQLGGMKKVRGLICCVLFWKKNILLFFIFYLLSFLFILLNQERLDRHLQLKAEGGVNTNFHERMRKQGSV